MSKNESDPDYKAFLGRQKQKQDLMAHDPCHLENINANRCLAKEPNCDDVLTKLYECKEFWAKVHNFYQRKYKVILVPTIKDREKAKAEYLASLSSDKS